MEQASYQRLSSRALRCNVARTLTGVNFVDFGWPAGGVDAVAMSCKLDRIDTVRIPGKRALQRGRQPVRSVPAIPTPCGAGSRQPINDLVGSDAGEGEGRVGRITVRGGWSVDGEWRAFRQAGPNLLDCRKALAPLNRNGGRGLVRDKRFARQFV